MSEVLNVDEVMATLRDIVAGKEDYIYKDVHDGCFYSDANGSPSCIAGHVFKRLAPEAFVKIAGSEVSGNSFTVRVAFDRYDLGDIDGPECLVLRSAQVSQDRGETWGDALARAGEVYKRIKREGQDD